MEPACTPSPSPSPMGVARRETGCVVSCQIDVYLGSGSPSQNSGCFYQSLPWKERCQMVCYLWVCRPVMVVKNQPGKWQGHKIDISGFFLGSFEASSQEDCRRRLVGGCSAVGPVIMHLACPCDTVFFSVCINFAPFSPTCKLELFLVFKKIKLSLKS